jgi:hypothetical protein
MRDRSNNATTRALRLATSGVWPCSSLVDKHRVEILEAGWRVVEREDNRVSLGAFQSDDADVCGEGVAEFGLKLLVVDKPCELEYEPVGDVETGEEHSASVHLFG